MRSKSKTKKATRAKAQGPNGGASWSPADDALVRAFARESDADALADKFAAGIGRSRSALHHRLSILGYPGIIRQASPKAAKVNVEPGTAESECLSMCKCKVEPVVFDEVRFLEGRPGRFKKVEGFSGVGCRLRGLTPKSGYSTYSYEGFSEAQVNAINGLIGGPGYGEPDLEETVQRMVDKAVLAAVNTLFLKGITVALESSPEPEIDVPDDAEFFRRYRDPRPGLLARVWASLTKTRTLQIRIV